MTSRSLAFRALLLAALSLPALALATPRGGEAPAPGAAPPAAGIEVTLTEGTNMAAALSPDGATLALDLQGRIWLLPVAGGTATALTDALGDARQPSWTPDGRTVVFQAYWDGNYHVWAVDAAGGRPRQLTFGPFDDREPTVSPDGRRIAFASDRGGNYDIWELELEGGALRRLTEEPSDEFTPSWGPDGSVAFVTDRDDDEGVWIRRPDGRAEQAVAIGGALGAPSFSPDGRSLAFSRVQGGRAELLVASLDALPDAAPRTISDDDEDVFPFRPVWLEGGALLYTADGRLRRRPAAGGRPSDVPFSATVTLERPAYSPRVRDFGAAGPTPVRGVVSPAVSPDGERVAFAALGDLWVVGMEGGAPERLTDDRWADTDPAWSPDGSSLVWASDREGTLDLWLRDLGSGRERRLTSGGGTETAPVWSPDGSRLAFVQSGGEQPGVKLLDVESGTVTLVRGGLNDPGRPTWSPDGRRLAVSALRPYSGRFREGVNGVLLMSLPTPVLEQEDGDGGATVVRTQQVQERWLEALPHGSVGARSTDGPVWSPDGRSIAFVSGGVLWVLPVTPDGEPAGPVRRLTSELADDPTWTGDSESIVYLATDRLVKVAVKSGRRHGVPIDLAWRRNVPEGRLVVHAGRLWDGRAGGLVSDRDVVIDGNRIVRVAPHDPALHAQGAQGAGGAVRVLDAGQGVVVPGLVEMHTHQGPSETQGRIWLAYGVTSVRETAADPYEARERRESIESGRRTGPRTFITGGTFDGSRIYYAGTSALETPLQVDLEMERAAALDYDLVKTYVRLSDPVMERIVERAHELGLPVTSHELYPAVGFGADGVEHVRGTSRRGYSPKVSALNRSYQDVVALLTASRMAITPTVGIYGGFAFLLGEDPSIAGDARARTFFPELAGRGGGGGGGGGMDPERRRRTISDMAATGRRVMEGGGLVIAGTDSPINPMGISLIAELEMFVRYGGMTPLQAMITATSAAAEGLGASADLGTIEPGKLADLVILEADPLSDIRNVRRVRTVITDGRVHELEALLARE